MPPPDPLAAVAVEQRHTGGRQFRHGPVDGAHRDHRNADHRPQLWNNMTKLINYNYLIIKKYNKIADKVLIDPGEVIYTLFNLRPIILSYPKNRLLIVVELTK